MKLRLHPDFKQHMTQHIFETYKILATIGIQEGKRIVGYVPTQIDHEWHGSKKDRNYNGRMDIIVKNEFDFNQMRRTDTGLLEFVNGTSKLQEDIIGYFQTRNEDDLFFNDVDIGRNLKTFDNVTFSALDSGSACIRMA